MDFQLKQWKDQHESERQHSSKIPKLFPEAHQPSGSALPLFLPEVNNLAAFPEAVSAATRFPRIASYFSLAQRQELEMQALIFRYMLAGAAVPPELLQPIKESVLHSHLYFLHYPSYQTALLQSGYLGKAAMDPEPGRCRRTDGKKWRCSRDVVAGKKYCERHMHRGRNRSRKPVESFTSSTVGGNGGGGPSLGAGTTNITAPRFTAAASTRCPFDLLELNQSSCRSKVENKNLVGNQNGSNGNSSSEDGRLLRHVFSDWPSSFANQDNAENSSNPFNSSTCLEYF